MLIIACWLVFPTLAAVQNLQGEPAEGTDAQSCAALAELNLENAPGGPALVTSARLIDVPSTGLERWLLAPGGYGSGGAGSALHIHQYCDVTGYIAPQNKFELKLPVPSEWNQKFFFYACGAFCGSVFGDACNLGLERGYASVTGNGGHDSRWGFDGVWAANAPELLEDFGWRSTHVVTLIAKAITTHYYGKPIKYSYMGGGSAAAWFAQAFTDGHGGSVLNAEAAQAIHKSVLEHCGAQAGIDEGLVTDPLSCRWQPEIIACTSGNSGTDCLNGKQIAAVRRLITPATNSKREVLYAYPYVPGTETMWAGWNYFGTPRPGITPRLANLELPGQHMRYLADARIREHADALHFDFDRDPATLGRSRRIYDATSFDLRAFKAHGGELLLWHGWADGAIMATSSIGYYEGQ